MFAISLRNLWEHKLRTLLLGGAIVIGVAFVVAAFVLTDAIAESFDNVFADASSGVDIQVTGAPDEAGGSMVIPGVPGDLADAIAAVDGVDAVVPTVQGIVTFDVDTDDDPMSGFGPPTFGVSWADVATPLRLIEGAAPVGADQVVLDATALDTLDAAIGDTVRIAPSGARFGEYEVVGELSYGVASGLMGVSFVAFDFDHAVDLFVTNDEIGGYAITVVDPDRTAEIVNVLNDDVLPEGVVAADAANAAEEQSADLRSGLSFITTFLLVFAGIALVVGAFVVYNAFQVVLAQRTRELGLLRVLGASRADITVSVMGEAALLGLVMGVIGIPVGWALGWAARAAIDAFGGGLPAGGLPLATRTIVIALALGTVVAIGSALLPALRANRVSPMAALRDQPELVRARRWVAWLGVVLTLGSLAVLATAAFGSSAGNVVSGDFSALTPVAIGTFGLFLGLVLVARILARPVIGVLGGPVRAVTVTLAKENARRTPTRTATTATSLMIGVGLVVMVAILINSLQDTIQSSLEEAFAGDLVVGPPGFNPISTLPVEVADLVAGVDGVERVARTNLAEARNEAGTTVFVSGVEPETIETFLTVESMEGSWDHLVGDTVVIQRLDADAKGLALGDSLALTIAGQTRDYEIVGIFALSGASDTSMYLPHATVAELTGQAGDAQIVVSFTDDADPEATREAVEGALAEFANLQITSVDDLSQMISAGLDGIQIFLTVLLLASVFVALFGIVLTLYLAVFERTREIGLLRVVGMTRGQLSGTIRWEAVFIACFGAVLGLVLGLASGWALSAALIGEAVTLAVPWPWIVGSLIGGVIAGFLASIIPAIAAARLDILRAITYE